MPALSEAAVILQQAVKWQQDGKVEQAERAYREVLALDPANPDALNLLAIIHHERGDRDLAIRMLRAAIKIQPSGRFYTNLGVVLGARGDRTGSVAAYRMAVQRNPSATSTWPAVIFSMDLHPHAEPAVRLADRRAFNARHCAALTAAAPPHANDRDPDRRLRIGYISADYTIHSASMVFGPVLEGHDHDAVEVFCYWQQEGPEDAVTERIRGQADHWRVVNTLDDDALAALIREDRIDVLVDLSGYSNGNRIMALARKPAPIIMTGWGHVTGLGIDACDYILADAITMPEGDEDKYHERALHLPCIVAFDPRGPYPTVAAPPAEQNGYVTFGYFGRANKTGEDVWATWAEILRRVPNSRLLLKGNDYTDEAYRQSISDFFVSLRISTHRFEFLGPSMREHHLETYNQIDIALDPFPQGGGVTTLEACLMGVPSVAMYGDYINARIAPSILNAVGRPWWVGLDRQHYVEIAVAMAQTKATVKDRTDLRAALLGSIMCRPRDYAASVEAAYRKAWAAWCADQPPETPRNGAATPAEILDLVSV